MKIAHISSTYKGGAGRAALRLHNAMLEQGIESIFYSNDIQEQGNNITTLKLYTPLPLGFKLRFFYKWRRIGLYQKNSEKKKMFDAFQFNFPKWKCECAELPFGHQNLRLISEIKNADVIILHWINGTIDIDHFFADFKKVPVIWTLHDMNPLLGLFHYKEDEVRNASLANGLNNQVLQFKRTGYSKKKKKMAIVAPSQWLAEESKNSELLGGYKTVCIPYSLDLQTFKIKNRDEIRKRLNLLPHQKVILFISDNVQNIRKGFDLLLDALKYLDDSKIILLALGSDNGNTDTSLPIRYIGKVNDDELMADYYNAADVFLLPSREDNLPNVMLEAMACGCPVIGFPIGGIKEHVINYKTGLLAEAISSQSLANAIAIFYNEADKFNRDEIQAYANKKFNSSSQVNAYLKLVKDL